jgi:hypothetical protein
VDYLGDQPSEYLRVELKTERPEKQPQHIRMPADDQKPFENGQLRISRTLCGALQPCAQSAYPSVVVSLNDRSVMWYEAGVVAQNARNESVRLIRVELKTKPAAQIQETAHPH